MTVRNGRFVSRLTPNTLALILAGGRGSRLGALTNWRTKPAVPFAGKFRIADFSLSNCLNSGIRKVCVLTQYRSHSLIQHLMKGWTFFNTEQGDFLDIIPAQQWTKGENWYQGTADAVHQSLDIIEASNPEYVLILAGDHIYTMDYGTMLAEHVEVEADFTVACITVSSDDARHFGVMEVDHLGRIIGFEEKPENPKPLPDDPTRVLVSMGIYVADRKFLSAELRRDAGDTASSHDFGKDIIPHIIKARHVVHAHKFDNPAGNGTCYWRDVGTVDAYFNTNMEMISRTPPIDLHDPTWPILTYQPQLPPAFFMNAGASNRLTTTLISGGCMVEDSRLERSILFSNVTVREGCELNSVLALPGCEIGSRSRLRNVILDNQCKVPEGTVIGEDAKLDAERFEVTESGLVVVNRVMLGQGEHYIPGVAPAAAKRSPSLAHPDLT